MAGTHGRPGSDHPGVPAGTPPPADRPNYLDKNAGHTSPHGSLSKSDHRDRSSGLTVDPNRVSTSRARESRAPGPVSPMRREADTADTHPQGIGASHTGTEGRDERSGEDGFDRSGAERDADRLTRRVDDLSGTVDELRGKSDDLDSRLDEIQLDIAELKAEIHELIRSGAGQTPGATFQPVAQLSVIEDDVFAAVEDNDSAPHGFFKRLQRMFKGIWALLWRFLSRFQVVKQWSLSGELGPVLGKVAVSVTFGRE
jgi:hypothetical protein